MSVWNYTLLFLLSFVLHVVLGQNQQRELANIDATVTINGASGGVAVLPQYNAADDAGTTYGIQLTPAVTTGQEITCTLSCTGPTSQANGIVLKAYYGSLPASNTASDSSEVENVFQLLCPVSFTHTVPSVNNGQVLFLVFFLDDLSANGDQLEGASVQCTVATPAPTPSPTCAPCPFWRGVAKSAKSLFGFWE